MAPWLAWVGGEDAMYRPAEHADVQMLGFGSAIAAGFLLTMLPRRTHTAPPARTLVVALAALPVLAATATWWSLAAARAAWVAFAVLALAFAVRRLRGAVRLPPDSFVWIPAALVLGIAGAVLSAAVDAGPWYRTGRALLLQAPLLGLVLGVSGLVVPLMTRGEPSRDGAAGRPWPRRAHLAAALALGATFAVEGQAPALGHGLRGAVVAAVLVGAAGAHRLPVTAGLHRKLIWLGAWAIPAGYATAAALPALPQLGLHVVFLGGFALMTMAVSLHVALAHGGQKEDTYRTSAPTVAMAAFVAVALACRSGAELDPTHRAAWLGLGAGAFVTATFAWAAVTLTALLGVTEGAGEAA